MTAATELHARARELLSRAICSCGEIRDHVVARRSTADGKHVLLWSDGSLTWALGYAIKGSAWPRTAEQQQRALRAGRLVLGEVCVYDACEVPALVDAARFVAARSGLPGDVRKRFAKICEPRTKPEWVVLQADRDGKPTVRVWRLNRVQYPGLAVWHERGRYDVVRSVRRDGVYESTGLRANTLRELLAMLPELAVR